MLTWELVDWYTRRILLGKIMRFSTIENVHYFFKYSL